MPIGKRKPITPEQKASHPSYSTTYKSWVCMRQRCYNPAFTDYDKYGGAGITVCDRWRYSFTAFLADMGPRPHGHTIDRIDGKGNYTHNNCRWATITQQNRNRSCARRVMYRGKVHLLADLIEQSGHTQTRVYRRLQRGWSIDRAIDTPLFSAAETNEAARRYHEARRRGYR
jgi:hypothetical protein